MTTTRLEVGLLPASAPFSLPTWQGRRGEQDVTFRDNGINGCTVLVALIGSAFHIGVCSVQLIQFIIDDFCQNIISTIRHKQPNYKGDYSFITQPEAYKELIIRGFLPVIFSSRIHVKKSAPMCHASLFVVRRTAWSLTE
jgi:hypothetical protein